MPMTIELLLICASAFLQWRVDDVTQNVIYMEVYDWPVSTTGCTIAIRTTNRLRDAVSGLLSDVAASKFFDQL